MKRVGRWLFNFAAAVSLLLCVATAGSWIRSYWWKDAFYYTSAMNANGLDEYGIISLPGRLLINTRHMGPGAVDRRLQMYGRRLLFQKVRYSNDWKAYPATGSDFWKSWFRHTFENSPPSNPAGAEFRSRYLLIPHWFVLMIVGLPGLGYISYRIVRRQKFRHGLCPACGYDLRATPERCPECGTIPTAPEGAAT